MVRAHRAPPGEPPAWAAHLPAGVDHAAVDLLAERSLPAAMARWAAAAPDRPALAQAGGGRLTRGELDEATRVVAGRLHRAGLGRGDRVAFSAATSLALVTAYLAALRLGLVAVPVNPAYSERELGHVIGDAAPRAAVVDDPDRTAAVRRAAGSDLLVVGPDVDLPDGTAPALDRAGPEDDALICYTSGTTGVPKGAVLSHGNLLAGVEAVRLAWRWDEADRLVLALPLFHVHGLCIGLHGTLLAGASAVLVPRFDAGAVLDAATDHDATLFFGVPTMYARLAASPRAAELGRLRLCVSGLRAARPQPCTRRLAERVRPAGAGALRHDRDAHERLQPLRGRAPSRHGRAAAARRLAAAGRRRGVAAARAQRVHRATGATRTRPRPRSTRTAGSAPATSPASTSDGYLRIEGRSKELIISGGYNVHPREVEEVLLPTLAWPRRRWPARPPRSGVRW